MTYVFAREAVSEHRRSDNRSLVGFESAGYRPTHRYAAAPIYHHTRPAYSPDCVPHCSGQSCNPRSSICDVLVSGILGPPCIRPLSSRMVRLCSDKSSYIWLASKHSLCDMDSRQRTPLRVLGGASRSRNSGIRLARAWNGGHLLCGCARRRIFLGPSCGCRRSDSTCINVILV